MLLTHRPFLLILISTSAIIDTSTVSPTTSTTVLITSPGLSNTDSTDDSTDIPINATSTATVAVTSIPSENTTAPFTNNATTPLLSTYAGNVTSPLSTQGNVTSSSTVAPENATSSSVSTPGNATASPAPAPVTTAAANSTSPLVPTPENATNHPVTSPGNVTTTPLPEPGNSTTPPQTTRGNDTTPPISTPSNSTASPITTAPFTNNATTPLLSTYAGNVTSPPLSTQGNVTSSSTVAPENATSSSVSTPGNATASPAPVTTAAANSTSPLVPTPENATNHPVTSPGNVTTTPLPEPGNSTTPPQTTRGNDTTPPISTPSNSTASPITTPSNVTIATQTTSATCPAVPCPRLSVCVNSICQCVTGTIPLNNACVETKTFPSTLRVNRTFEEAMNNPQSPEFKKTAKEIIAAVNEALRNQPNYINSTVTQLMSGSIVATVNSFFEPNSPVTQELFTSAMKTAISDCEETNCGILANAEYTATNLCEQDPPPCDINTTLCETKDGTPNCICKPGHISSHYQSRSCRVCPSGYKAQEDMCVRCPFGYSGFNCDDSSLLALVVVACVLGGILLIVILAVLIYICASRSKKKSSSNYYNSPYPAEESRTTWPSQDITHIPRATLTSSSSIDATGNSLEMSEGPGKKGHSNGLSGSYDLRTDDMRTFKDINPTRYSYLVGHENPYFIQGEEKR